MFSTSLSMWLIPGFPLLGALLAFLFGAMGGAKKFAWFPVLACSVMSFFTVLSVLNRLPETTPVLNSTVYNWFAAGPLQVPVQLTIDPLTAIFLLVITFIGSWIVLFAAGYMSHDEHPARFFSVVSLFLSAMCLLVMGNNFLTMFAGWEGVGLCSYLLVGFWYTKPSAAAAARKAFLVTRLGDVGLILGIALLWKLTGYALDYETVFAKAKTVAEEQPFQLSLACLLLFCGAAGKSAQFPLYVWLPDAMEGPTPVSALIHAATMVTAGVYLLARCAVLYSLVPSVQVIIAVSGGLTAIIAAYIALTQHDLKRVLAYSTVSQLGYMFMALGCVGVVPAQVAAAAAVFHVFTHAFFKAVLFLGAGSVMHAMGDVIDMRKFSGLRKVMPATHMTFLFGSAALAGLPILSGFWSKDQILESLLEASHGPHGTIYLALFGVGLLTAFMTAFYTFRAYFRTFHGVEKIPEEAHGHAHESPGIMTGPLWVLGIGALVAGVVAGPLTHSFSNFIHKTPVFQLADAGKDIHHEANWLLILGSVAVAIAGVALAYTFYGNGTTEKEDRLARSFRLAYSASYNRLYVDEIYNILLVSPMNMLAQACRGLESLLADVVRLIASLPQYLAQAFRPMQNGLLQFYGLSMVMGVVAFVGYLVLWAGK